MKINEQARKTTKTTESKTGSLKRWTKLVIRKLDWQKKKKKRHKERNENGDITTNFTKIKKL